MHEKNEVSTNGRFMILKKMVFKRADSKGCGGCKKIINLYQKSMYH